MTSLRRKQINQLADVIRDACGVKVPASEEHLKKMVATLGGTYSEKSDMDVEAMIEKTSSKSFAITLSEGFMPTRRKFSVAHELGHLFLHMGFLTNAGKWEQTQLFMDSARFRLGRNEEEFEANEFAAALLMPKNEFERVANQKSDGDLYRVDEIAQHFEVSLQAALTRGRWLGLFPCHCHAASYRCGSTAHLVGSDD
jgi:Zn-dependent peptidase ImmA (M78 family)